MEGDESMQTLKELVGRLPPDLQQEVRDFVEFLLERYGKKPKGKSRFKWASVLKELRDEYATVELQHRISEWRISGMPICSCRAI